MTQPRLLSDDDLEQLLRATFADHEPLADVETAHRIATAPPPGRRAWPAVVGVAAGVALIAGAGIGVVRGNTSTPSAGHGPMTIDNAGVGVVSSAPAAASSGSAFAGSVAGGLGLPAAGAMAAPNGSVEPATDAEALAATKSEARRVLRAFSAVMTRAASGTRRHATSPTPALRPLEYYIGPSDTSLTLTGWWTVPRSAGDLQTYLDATPVLGRKPEGWGSSAGPRHETPYPDTSYSWPSTAAYTTPSLAVTLQPAGATTYVRVDTFIAARHARSDATRLQGDVSSATVPSGDVTDATTVGRLRRAFDALPGSSTVPWDGSCPVGDTGPTLRLTFHTSAGDLVVQDVPSTCGPDVVTVVQDGAALAPTLDGGQGDTSFRQQVARIVGAGQ